MTAICGLKQVKPMSHELAPLMSFSVTLRVCELRFEGFLWGVLSGIKKTG